MKLTNESKLFIGVIVATILIIGIALVIFTRPSPSFSKSELITKDTHTKGPENAKVFLVEFSDFQCPACKAFKAQVDSITEKNKDSLYYAYKHFPLDQHPYGFKAALAVEAAAEQGKFWEMSDLLFQDQENLSDQLISDYAKKLGLNLDKFEKEIKEEKYKDRILADKDFGIKAGVNSTPTFYLNGQKISLFSNDDLTIKVEEALRKSKGN